VGGYTPRAREDSMRPRRLVGASGRPLSFTVRLRFDRSRASLVQLIYPTHMAAATDWRCFLACSSEAAATPVVHYLRLHDCPALVFPVWSSSDLPPTAEVRVPVEFLARARHIWKGAGDLTDGELEYLATGELPGATAGPRRRDDAA
jgi:hypothetical protein